MSACCGTVEVAVGVVCTVRGLGAKAHLNHRHARSGKVPMLPQFMQKRIPSLMPGTTKVASGHGLANGVVRNVSLRSGHWCSSRFGKGRFNKKYVLCKKRKSA